MKTYDPVGETWTVQSDLTDYRWYPSMVPLANGEFLVAGGGGFGNPIRTKTSEVMDPATLTWTASGDLTIGNEVSPIVLLYTGEVLMTHRPPQLYNPATGQWRLADAFEQGPRTPDGDHADHELVLLRDGRVAAIGYDSYVPGVPGKFLEIYDPVSDRWSFGADQAPVRKHPCTVMLPDGKVLVIGGKKMDPLDPTPTNAWGYVKLVDLYDPVANSWTRLAPVNVAREYHATPILVPDGRVIIVGGEAEPGNPPPQSVIEAYSPPYLFQGPRPEVRNLSKTSLVRGDTIEFDVANAPGTLKVVMMGAVASTHFMDSGNGRYLELTVRRTGNRVCATVPVEANRAVYGHYILFALSGGIPSVGRMVRVGPGAAGPDPCEPDPPPPPDEDASTIAATKVSSRTNSGDPSRSRAVIAAILDLGPQAVYPPSNAKITVDGFLIEVPAFEAFRGGFRYVASGVTVLLKPSSTTSSRAEIVIQLSGANAAGLPSEGPLDVTFETGELKAEARVVLARGAYSSKRAGTALVSPEAFLSTAKFVVAGAGRDSLRLSAGLAGLGAAPAQAPDVFVELDGHFAETVTGDKFVRRGSTYRYRGAAGGLTSLVIDYARGRVSVRGKGLSLGTIAEGPLPLTITVDVGGDVRTMQVRMVRKGRTVRY